MTEQPYTNKHGRPDVPPDETTFTIHGTIKGSVALKEYFKKRSTQKRGEAQIEHFKNGTMAVRDGKTEPESIFQACEWVLSQTKLQ